MRKSIGFLLTLIGFVTVFFVTAPAYADPYGFGAGSGILNFGLVFPGGTSGFQQRIYTHAEAGYSIGIPVSQDEMEGTDWASVTANTPLHEAYGASWGIAWWDRPDEVLFGMLGCDAFGITGWPGPDAAYGYADCHYTIGFTLPAPGAMVSIGYWFDPYVGGSTPTGSYAEAALSEGGFAIGAALLSVEIDGMTWLEAGDVAMLAGAGSELKPISDAFGPVDYGFVSGGPHSITFRLDAGGGSDVGAVPIPGAVYLLGSGLIGLVGLRKRLGS